ncbi:MAG: lactonase family protein [Bacteroidetes bacterium]|nr:lactonase family protein [Bacteroidota bacterium]MDA1121221.1 lactonase family protein [Bacteroidota bacterium]
MKLSFYQLATVLIVTSLGSCSPQQSNQEESTEEQSARPSTIELLAGNATGIHLLNFDPSNGSISKVGFLVEARSPSYFQISDDRQYVYSVNEGKDGGASSFKWNRDSSRLELLSQQPSNGDYPCYVDIDASEKMMAVGNYGTGNIAIYTINDDHQLQPPAMRQHEGSGPQPSQNGPRAHCARFKGDFMYAVDLGIDKILSYPVNGDMTVGEAKVAIAMDPGDGPRHLIFHPTKDMAFAINELSSTIVSMKANYTNGTFERIDKASTLPDDFTEKNSCADIHITPDGKFLYGSNRGHNSIAIFAVSEEGMLTSLGQEPVRGSWPRNFTLSPDGNYLIVANRRSNNIVVFKIDRATGLLAYTGNEVELEGTACLKFN